MTQEGLYLCYEVIYEILSRVSIETLARCRAICREWNEIANDPRVMDLVCTGWRHNIAGYYNRWNKYVSTDGQGHTPDMSFKFITRGRDLRIVACDQGILLCRILYGNRTNYLVCKPCTKEWVKIPSPKSKYWTRVMAIQVVRARPYYVHFKILRVSEHSKNKFWYDIFDSKVWRWKRLAVVDHIGRPEPYFLANVDVVIVGGKANWIGNNNLSVFDMHNETLSVVPLCIESDREMADLWTAQLLDHEGQLGILLLTKERDEVYLFVMEGKDPITKRPVWRKTNSYDLRAGMGWMASWSPNVVLSVQIQSMIGRCDGVRRVLPFHSDFLPCNLTDLVKEWSTTGSSVFSD